MPVRSLHSAVLKWPDRAAVHRAAAEWAKEVGRAHPEVRRVGYFGSYAAGNWGVGSDLDLVVVVDDADAPFEQRSLKFPMPDAPVPCDVLVYTQREWDRLLAEGTLFAQTLQTQTVWVFER